MRRRIARESSESDIIFFIILGFLVSVFIGGLIWMNKSGYYEKVYAERKAAAGQAAW